MLVGINLLREGLDLPEVSLVAILDADKEGFLRSATCLIQTMGRAARNVDGQVVMYADRITDSMRHAISETNRRRKTAARVQRGARHRPPDDSQEGHRHPRDGATARQRRRARRRAVAGEVGAARAAPLFADLRGVPPDELGRLIQQLDEEMHEAAKELRFEEAARLRDEINELKRELKAVS